MRAPYDSEGHPDVIKEDGLAPEEAYQSDLAYLKQKVTASMKVILFYNLPKSIWLNSICTILTWSYATLVLFPFQVDAGADLIVTQLFYDTDIFLKFVNDCRQIGITCPIVPGIMPINNYKGFIRMTGFCKTKVSVELL